MTFECDSIKFEHLPRRSCLLELLLSIYRRSFWDNLRVEIPAKRLCRKFQRSRRRSCRKFALKLQDENFEILKKGYLFGRSVTICKRAARSKEEFQRRQGSDCADKGQLISLHLLRISKSCRALENMCER